MLTRHILSVTKVLSVCILVFTTLGSVAYGLSTELLHRSVGPGLSLPMRAQAVPGNLELGVIPAVEGTWRTVVPANTYPSPVVTATANYESSPRPIVVRVRNVTGSSCDVRLKNPAHGGVAAGEVHYVVEEGPWRLPDGAPIEAARVVSASTNENHTVGEKGAQTEAVTAESLQLSDLPDWVYDEGGRPRDPLDLWAHTSGASTPLDELIYTLEGPPPPGAGITLTGNRTLDVSPNADWCGYTDATVRVTDPTGQWDEDTFRVAVTWSCQGPLPNLPPVADAGPDLAVSDADGDGLETVFLDGSASTDPDGAIVGYEWTEGQAVLATTAAFSTDVSVGVHTVVLTVTDDRGATASDETTVTIRANQPPTADAGLDRTITDTDKDGFETAVLDGSASTDLDGAIVGYEWWEGQTALATTATFTTDLSIGVHTFMLTVTDSGSATASDTVVLTVTTNQPPVASLVADPTSGMTPLAVSFDASASSDPDGTIVSYVWDLGDGATGTGVTFSHKYILVGTYPVTLTVIDDEGATDAAGVTIAVQADLEEWTQHGHDAQHSSYTEQVVDTPWRWKWAWNGPDASGAIVPDKTSLPKTVQPVTGGGRVYVAAGSRGIYALDAENGNELWDANPGAIAIRSTVAYDAQADALYAFSTNGILYVLAAENGNVLGQYDTGSPTDIPLPPTLVDDRVFLSAGSSIYAIDKVTMTPIWLYDAGSTVQTPPAYSPTRDRVVVGTQDLYVHAIDNVNGAQAWRVKPTVRNEGDTDTEYLYGWPVIAEEHGLVLMKLRLDWNTMWTWSPWPTTNAQIRSNLIGRPDQQALFAMNLDDGSVPFICNVGHGGFGNGSIPMGPQPVVKRFPDGTEVVYTIGRGDRQYDGRWDSKFVEMLLDDTTVPGYSGGEVRFIAYDRIVLTDEQPNPSMAGDYLFAGHWMAGHALRVTDRSDPYGAYDSRIQATDGPYLTTSASNCGYSASHYCSGGLVQDGDPRRFPPGFYIYYGEGTVYDDYWSEYAAWVVSQDAVYFRSCDGAIVALEHGDPG